MASVVLENLTKKFGDVTAVDGISLEAEDKEFLVLVGPSGCGKTSTLRMIAGLDDVTSGTIQIDGRVVNKLSPRDRDIAMVFQSYALYPHMNVYNNMAFGLKVRRTPRAEIRRRVNEAASNLGLEDLLKRKPKQLSGGQRQRVALGRAIVREPAVFLMDEPLSNLDAMLRVQTRRELITLHRRIETTVVYVTHDQTEAMTMGTRIAVMNGGKLQQVAKPQVLYDFPDNTFVAAFIGSPQMNLVEGEVKNESALALFRGEGLSVQLSEPVTGALATQNSAKVVLGLRPEHIRLAIPSDDGAGIDATVDVIEHLGSELIVYFRIADGATLAAQLAPATQLEIGQATTIALDMNQAHLFDSGTREAIVHASAPSVPR